MIQELQVEILTRVGAIDVIRIFLMKILIVCIALGSLFHSLV